MTLQASLSRAPKRTKRQAGLRHLVRGLAGSAAFVLATASAAGQQWTQPRTNFGSIGLIEMPSARMAPDGDLSLSASFFEDNQHFNLGFQALPWLETSFRYSGIRNLVAAYPTYYDRSFAFKIRLWNENEYLPAVALGVNDAVGTGVYAGEYLVASKQFGDFDTTLGLGWGRLGSDGAFRNPFSLLGNSFRSRPDFTQAGESNFNVFFHGPTTGIFGGILWHTPVEGLQLLAEYSSDTYALEKRLGSFSPRNQFNIGASYEVLDGVRLGLNWLYGRTLDLTFSFAFNPTTPRYETRFSTPPTEVVSRTPEQQQRAIAKLTNLSSSPMRIRTVYMQVTNATGSLVDRLFQDSEVTDLRMSGRELLVTARTASATQCGRYARMLDNNSQSITTIVVTAPGLHGVRCTTTAVTAQASRISADGPGLTPVSFALVDAREPTPQRIAGLIKSDAAKQQISVLGIKNAAGTETVLYANTHYSIEAEAIGRLTRILMMRSPPDIERFLLIPIVNGVAQKQVEILRMPMERAFEQESVSITPGNEITVESVSSYVGGSAYAGGLRFPQFSWQLTPAIRESTFDPNQPFGVQLLAAASGAFRLSPGFSINGEVETSIYDNFATGRVSDSLLPHVRSDFLQYFNQGKTGIGQLDGEYRFRADDDLYGIVKAGFLESMFAGAGGEILWRPSGQRWALGADLYYVRQRDFDRLFGLQNYSAVTGHASIYYQSPWYGMNFALSVGRYLAGDSGLTFQMTRRFVTGVEIGAFVTRTNVSATQFGEGSFDKGIIIRIPLDWLSPLNTQSRLSFDLRPVQRDGGQRLLGDAVLYDDTMRTSDSEIFAHLESVISP